MTSSTSTNGSITEDPLGGGRVQAFGQSRQDHGDLVRGSLQPVQGGVASGTERVVVGQAGYNDLQSYCATLGLTWGLMTNVILCVF